MATVLHSQLSQIQPPNSHSHHHHHLQHHHQQPFYTTPTTPAQGHFFCIDCGVMFESSTSLEVNLSYHKENLLTRWASQDNHSSNNNNTLEKSSSNTSNCSSSSSLPSPNPNTQINHRADNNSSVDSTESTGPPPQYFQQPSSMEPQYLPPLYNNNTGDPHHLLPSSRFTPLPIDSSSPAGNPLPLFHAPENFHPNFHPLFSPSHGHLLEPHHQQGQGHSSGQQQQQQPPAPGQRETPAEILDLDSHKVHVYQHQQQQQQGFFHRPYLPHLLPPPQGWPAQEPPSPSFRFSPAVSYPNNVEFFAPPQQSTNGPNNNNNHSPNGALTSQAPPPPITYDIIRIENAAYSDMYTNGQSNQQSGGNGSGPTTFGQPSPYSQQQQQVQSKQEKVSPGAVPAPTKGQRRSPSGPGIHDPLGPPPGVKTKGWKGGECKRPKTYNCPVCNKWFTSSGHLKRHYGTTLHKNSMKNLGENAEEILKSQPKGKKGGAKAQVERKPRVPKNSTRVNNNSNNSSSPMAGNNNNNSPEVKSNMIFPPPQQHEHDPLSTNGGHELKLFHSVQPPLSSPGHNNHDIKLFHSAQQQQQPSSLPSPNVNNNGFNNLYVSPAPYGLPMSHHLPPQHSPHIPFTTTANSNFMMDYAYNPNNNGPPNNNNGNPIVYVGGATSGDHEPNNNGDGSGNQNQEDQGQINGPLPPFSSVGMSHYTGGNLPPIDPYHHHQQQQNPNNQQISPQNGSSGGQGPVRRPPSFEGHFSANGGGEENRSSIAAIVPGTSSPSSSLGSGDEMQSMSMEHSLSSGGGSSGSGCDESSGGENSSNKEVLKCPDCSKTFGRSCYLTQHANSSHSGGIKPFKCSICGKRYAAEPALSSHEAKHGAEKPYKCTLCIKSFNHKTDLRRHLCLHTGEKPFVCGFETCQKGFIRKDHMTKHLETHRKKSTQQQQQHI